MTTEERKQRIAIGCEIIAKSAVHRKYKERLMLLRGMTPQKITSTLRKIVAYIIDNPNADLGRVYAGAFGLTINGSKVPNVIS